MYKRPPIARDITLPNEPGTFRLVNPTNPCYRDGPCTPCALDARVSEIGYGHPDTEQTSHFLSDFSWTDTIRERDTTVLIQHGHYIRLDNKDRKEHPEGGIWQYWQWSGSKWELHQCAEEPLMLQRVFILVCVVPLPERRRYTVPTSMHTHFAARARQAV